MWSLTWLDLFCFNWGSWKPQKMTSIVSWQWKSDTGQHLQLLRCCLIFVGSSVEQKFTENNSPDSQTSPPGSPLSLSLAPLQCHKALVLKVSGRSQISQLEFITQFFPELLFTSSHILLLFSPSPHLPLSHSPPHVPWQEPLSQLQRRPAAAVW